MINFKKIKPLRVPLNVLMKSEREKQREQKRRLRYEKRNKLGIC